MVIPTEAHAKKIVELMRLGVCAGLGQPQPGQMCIEALTCYVLGERHHASPECVNGRVRWLQVTLNDSKWSSDMVRGRSLQKLAVAQLGSKDAIDEEAFLNYVCLYFFKLLLPLMAQNAINHMEKAIIENAATVGAIEKVALIADLIKGMEDRTELGTLSDTSSVAYLLCNQLSMEIVQIIARSSAATALTSSIRSLLIFCYDRNPNHLDSMILHVNCISNAAPATDILLKACAEALLQALIKVESPGCQWLHLAEDDTPS